MKKVFPSNSQVCHTWAQQTQIEGRSSSISFRDSVIFSYGEHFPMAKIHTVKGKRFAIINSSDYSVTTGQHKSQVRNALKGLMPYFSGPDVYKPKEAVKWLDSNAKACLELALKRKIVRDVVEIKFTLKRIHEEYETASNLRNILGLVKVYPNPKKLHQLILHFKKRLARYRELNTPEKIAKKEAKRARLQEIKQVEVRRIQAEGIFKFKAGLANSQVPNLPFELLRVKGETLQTTRGAEVPLKDAKSLCRAIVAGVNVIGKTIGDFTIDGIIDYTPSNAPHTKVIKVGCHRILLSEAVQVLGLT